LAAYEQQASQKLLFFLADHKNCLLVVREAAEAEPPLGRARATALGPCGRSPRPHPPEAAGAGAGEADEARNRGRRRRRRCSPADM